MSEYVGKQAVEVNVTINDVHIPSDDDTTADTVATDDGTETRVL